MNKEALAPALLALQDMALFVAVARVCNFTRASRVSGIPVATLSRRIALLEKRLGVRLFERHARGLALTTPGKRYLERCERVVQEADIAHEALREAADALEGLIRVASPVEFGLHHLAPLVEEFAQRHPGIQMALDLSPRPDPLSAQTVDVRIRLGEPDDDALIARKLGQLGRGLFASPAYIARRGEPDSPDSLPAHDCVLMKLGPQHPDWRLQKGGEQVMVAVRGRFASNNISMLMQLAERGHGIAPLPLRMTEAACADGRLRQVLPEWRLPDIPAYALTTSRLLPQRVRAFVDFLASRMSL